ncbi:hypothetical protein [Actinoplanes derwentensis]|nr:hypothetical protein [Actinoplanes derwentensis]
MTPDDLSITMLDPSGVFDVPEKLKNGPSTVDGPFFMGSGVGVGG